MSVGESSKNTVDAKKTYRCSIIGCNASFSKNNKLTYHLRKHRGERPFVCDEPECGKTYTNSSHLRRHKKVTHGGESQTVICDFEGCGITLANKYSLKKHRSRLHNPERAFAFSCSECPQGFGKKKQLQKHLYVHTGVAPFKCDEEDCRMSFVSNTDFNKHKRFHRTYTCKCGEKFSRWSLILTHRKLCKKPDFKCEICCKTFSHLGNFKNHKLVHTKGPEQPMHLCPYVGCTRSYRYKKNLIYHINYFHKEAHKNQKFSCTYPGCRIVLKTKLYLKRHLALHFQWKKKKVKKPRCDKGKVKTCMASILSGLEAPPDINKSILNASSIRSENEKITDDQLLNYCGLTLKLLDNQIRKI